MGFDNMRSGHARCPNYLLAALFLMCFLLTCNWWSLSSQNYELLKQMDDMGDQLKICADEKLICMSRKNTLESQSRDAESRLAESKMNEVKSTDKLRKQKDEITNLNKTLEESKQSLSFCQTELESLKKVDSSKTTMIATLRLDKETIAAQLTEAKGEIKELAHALKAVKPTSTAKSLKTPPESMVLNNNTPSSLRPKSLPDPQDLLPINDGPVNNGNHESNYGDVEPVLENAANEDLDDDLGPKKF
ncbi:uncharacterized protein LOC143915655 [Arctopsyche grandis]|uniref:uncharacterized protein LOC143915655 n=1 Tax=Arctopsyche grandis TaxID=121162 RepID=UPI00406D8F92